METAVAITGRMKYGVKPSAVWFQKYLHNLKTSNGPQFDMQMGQDISFNIVALGNGITLTFSLLTSE